MNTNTLKKFARQARTHLIAQISTKLEQVLHTDSIAFREKDRQIEQLAARLRERGKAALIEEVAYTWFNRLMALRFMDANGYTGLRVLSPAPGDSLPEILQEAKRGQVDEDLPLDRQRLFDLLDGKLPSANPQNEVYQMLLVAECNRWHRTMPFMFQRIQDYTELLMPEDVLSEHSVVHEIREGMSETDCQNVEIIGWLYQFYIAEKKDEVFASKGKVKKEEIPAATQLFTPNWIVRYLVENSLGRLYWQNFPNSGLKGQMKYYVESPEEEEGKQADEYLKITRLEEINFCDPACGSGHILVYGFDLLAKMYEEQGYASSEIPNLILKNNLYGIEIDDRAASLAAFALMMKARAYNRRFFRKEPEQPQVIALQDIDFSENELEVYLEKVPGNLFTGGLKATLQQFEQAKNFGSLIQPEVASVSEVREYLKARNFQEDIFLNQTHQKVLLALRQADFLLPKYHCVVANPPYMGGGNMNSSLANFVKKHYPDSKADLFSAFIERSLAASCKQGFIVMITMQSWMFLSSFEKLRIKLIDNFFISNLIQIGYNSFPELNSKVAQAVAFVIQKAKQPLSHGVYINLNDVKQSADKERVFIEKLKSKEVFFRDQKDFAKIPGSPIGYWLSQKFLDSFKENDKIGDKVALKAGLSTGNNIRFQRLWFEIAELNFSTNTRSLKQTESNNIKWYPCHSGGDFRKWYGNHEVVINWLENGKEIRNFGLETGKIRSAIRNESFYFREGITWTKISSGSFAARYRPMGFIFDDTGRSGFAEKELESWALGLFCSKFADEVLRLLCPTLSFTSAELSKIPFPKALSGLEMKLIDKPISISRSEWDSHETSWDFQQNELVKRRARSVEQGAESKEELKLTESDTVKEAYQTYQTHWRQQFAQLHANEEELNRIFIEIYGLQDELTPEVALEDITILKAELDDKALKKATKELGAWSKERGAGGDSEESIEDSTLNRQVGQLKFPIGSAERFEFVKNALAFKDSEVFAQLVSYAVGCMMGRYSLDQPGLILANQGEGLAAYAEKTVRPVGEWTFPPDDDGIIPLLAEDYFTDDVVGRFRAFLKAAFGEAHFEENLRFVEEALGRDLRSYFVREFYKDHLKRYKKRPIYWLFSSPGKHFQALVYLHRYRPDTVSKLLNDYLREFIRKLEAQRATLVAITLKADVSAREKTQAQKEIDQIDARLEDARTYEREILYPLAARKLPLDLDDGVLVNYNRMGKAVLEVAGLNDGKARRKVMGFDWVTIDV